MDGDPGPLEGESGTRVTASLSAEIRRDGPYGSAPPGGISESQGAAYLKRLRTFWEAALACANMAVLD